MSVNGEFRRVAAECVALVEAHSSRNGAAWCAALERAVEQASDDLSAAARGVLDLHERCEAPGFVRAEDRNAFEERDDHLLSICRIIVGD